MLYQHNQALSPPEKEFEFSGTTYELLGCTCPISEYSDNPYVYIQGRGNHKVVLINASNHLKKEDGNLSQKNKKGAYEKNAAVGCFFT